nr:10 kda antigen=BCG-a homolog [Mycobacterium tuberculosis, Peptide Partial, 15 aa] [Mycobacterium tuberculosis]
AKVNIKPLEDKILVQ